MKRKYQTVTRERFLERVKTRRAVRTAIKEVNLSALSYDELEDAVDELYRATDGINHSYSYMNNVINVIRTLRDTAEKMPKPTWMGLTEISPDLTQGLTEILKSLLDTMDISASTLETEANEAILELEKQARIVKETMIQGRALLRDKEANGEAPVN